MGARYLLWRTVPLCFVLCVWRRCVEILVGLEYLPLKQNKFYSRSLNVWSENHNTRKYEACTFEIWWSVLMDEGTATVRKMTTGIWTGVPLMHKLPYLIYKWFLGLLPRSLYHSSNRLLSDMNEQPLRTFFTSPETWQSHGDKSRLYLFIYFLIDWLAFGFEPFWSWRT